MENYKWRLCQPCSGIDKKELGGSKYSPWKRLSLNDKLTSQTKDIDRDEEEQVS